MVGLSYLFQARPRREGGEAFVPTAAAGIQTRTHKNTHTSHTESKRNASHYRDCRAASTRDRACSPSPLARWDSSRKRPGR
jgi:hypothetical protein